MKYFPLFLFFLLMGCSQNEIIKNTLNKLNSSTKQINNLKTCDLDPFYCNDFQLCVKVKGGISSYIQEAKIRELQCFPSNEIFIKDTWKKLNSCLFHSGYYKNGNYYVILELSSDMSVLKVGNINQDFSNNGTVKLKIDDNKLIKETLERKTGYKQKFYDEINLTWRIKFFNELINGNLMFLKFSSHSFKVSLKGLEKFKYEIKRCKS